MQEYCEMVKHITKEIESQVDLCEQLLHQEGLAQTVTQEAFLKLKDLQEKTQQVRETTFTGDLTLTTLPHHFPLPKEITGSLDLSDFTTLPEGLHLPEHVGVYLFLDKLTSAEGLTLPKHVGGYLSLDNLTTAEGLTLPKNIGGSLSLNSLTSAEKEELKRKHPHLRIL